MPRVTRRSAAAAKSSSMSEVKTTTKKAVLVEDGDTARIDSTVASQTAKPEPQFFETFDTAANLSDGLCVIRKRDDGRYEMMSLNSTAHEDIAFGSMDFSRLVRDDQSGERLKMLEDVAKTWKGAEFRVGQALDSANLRLFRFLKLPIELRYRIYDMTVCSSSTLRHGNYQYGAARILGGIQLRATCRQVYEETRNFFWRNSFRIDFSKEMKPLTAILTENLREVKWDCWSFKIKDPVTLRMLSGCVNLKILHIRLTRYCIDIHNTGRQTLHQNEPAVAKFKKMHGFDELFSLRGLKTVTVANDMSFDLRIPPGDLSDEELKAFEAFLVKEITQPRILKIVHPEAAAKGKNTSKTGIKTNKKLTAKATTKKRNSAAWANDDDEYLPRG